MSAASGDGWTLHLGDCYAGMDGLEDSTIDVVITDPPYSDHTHSKQWVGASLTASKKRGTSKSGREYASVSTEHAGLTFECITPDLARTAAEHFARLSRRWVLVFTDIEGIPMWAGALGVAGLKYVRTCIWDKVDGVPQMSGDRPAVGTEAIVVAHQPGRTRWNGGGRRNVFRHSVNGQRGAKPHPTTKPVPLMEELVSLFSDPGELVLDPFAGSGTTGVACRKTGRMFIGWEKDPGYHSIAANRIASDEGKPNPSQIALNLGGAA